MSGLHTDPKLGGGGGNGGGLGQGGPIPSIQTAGGRTEIPIVMNQDMYGGTEEQQCFVLVDDRTVGVMPGDGTMQRLLTTPNPTTTTTTISLGSEDAKGVEMVQVEGKDAVEMMHVQASRTVLQMDDGKTLELVQMDGGKTLEVMNIDAASHPDVLQVEGSPSIEVISDGSMDKVPITNSTSASTMVLDKRKGKRLLHSPKQHGGGNTPGINLRSITAVTPSIVLSTGKRIITSQNFGHVTPPPQRSTFLTPNKPHGISTSTGLPTLAHVKSNIIFSDTKQVLSTSDSGMNDAIIISWPTLEPELDNTVATQTDICDYPGPSMNLFFCTFYADGSVQTQCDMPMQCHKEVSTEGRGRCGAQVWGWGGGNQSHAREKMAVKINEEGMCCVVVTLRDNSTVVLVCYGPP